MGMNVRVPGENSGTEMTFWMLVLLSMACGLLSTLVRQGV